MERGEDLLEFVGSEERERARVPGSVRIIRRLRFNSEVVRLVLSKCTDGVNHQMKITFLSQSCIIKYV